MAPTRQVVKTGSGSPGKIYCRNRRSRRHQRGVALPLHLATDRVHAAQTPGPNQFCLARQVSPRLRAAAEQHEDPSSCCSVYKKMEYKSPLQKVL